MIHLSSSAFEILFNSTPHLAILLDADHPTWPVLAVSDSFLAVNHQTREALLGKPFPEVSGQLGHPLPPDQFRASVEQVLATGQSHQLSQVASLYSASTGQAATRYWNVETHIVQLPEPTGAFRRVIQHTATDVTDQVIARQAQTNRLEQAESQNIQLLEESQTLKDLIDSSRVNAYTLVPVKDAGGQIIDFRFKAMTPQFREHLAAAQPNATHATISEMYPHFQQDPSFRHYCNALLQGNPNSYDLLHAEGSSGQWWHKTITRLSPEEVLVTMIDQTDIKRVQLQLEQTIDALKRSNANLEEFAYAASHDLQEPLRKIQTFCTMLHTRLGDSSDSQSVALLARMQSAAVRMRTLIEDLLQYSRLPLGNDSFETVCLKETIEEVMAKTTGEIASAGGTLTISGLEPVWGSATQLQLLFTNLLDNAVKFAHKERPLEVRITGRVVTAAEAALDPVQGSPSRMYLQVDVSDNGIGFEQQYAERMFQIFQRLHGRSEATGTGVGLSMVQKIVLNHQGRVTATGVPGEGATFTFWLVLAADPTDCP
ncbi:MAG: hypothetical protein EOP52_03375 [Sphingobacteriales bacterium]|nr:MAG: hypothetical protein EOP52_03375 [Sphingobacteriales bacterium]